jgi:hypothetical protein
MPKPRFDRCSVGRRPSEAQLYKSALTELVRLSEAYAPYTLTWCAAIDRAKAVLRYRGRDRGMARPQKISDAR